MITLPSGDYIPGPDKEFDNWQDNLINLVIDKMDIWGIPIDPVIELVNVQHPWEIKWSIGKQRSTRGHVDVVGKDGARVDLERDIRFFVKRFLSNNPLVTDQDKAKLQITIRKTTRTTLLPPDTKPSISFKKGNGNWLELHYRQAPDQEGVSKGGKPKGVSGIEIWWMIVPLGTPAPKSYKDYTDKDIRTGRSPYVFSTELEELGMCIYAIARWVNRKNEHGPWCTYIWAVIG